MRNKDFNYKEFKDVLLSSDLSGLKYLYDNELYLYDYNDNYDNYILTLFKATKYLNYVIDLTENYKFENNFNRDLYFDTKMLLLEELGFDIEELYS